MTKKMTRASRLQHLEEIIYSGIGAVGEALTEIQQNELYLETHDSFEKYAEERWGFKRSQAYQLIKNAKTLDNVSSMLDVNTGKTLNNRQLTEIGKLPEEQQPQAVAEVFSTCEQEGRKPTAKDFVKAVKSRKVDAVLEIPVSATVTETEEYEDVEDEDEPPIDTSFADDSAAIAAAARELDRISRLLKSLAETPAGACLQWQQVDIALKGVKADINASIKWVDCPMCDCDGSKCNECRGIGWLPGRKRQQLSTEAKARIGQ